VRSDVGAEMSMTSDSSSSEHGLKFALPSLSGEIESCLAYTQKSEGWNLPERPLFQ
jgi:hypothetical protein